MTPKHSAMKIVRKRWPLARVIASEVGGWFISLGLGDGRELAYRQDGDIAQLWKDAAANVNKYGPDEPETKPTEAVIGPKPFWLTKEGEKIALTDMSDSHLQNTIHMLGRRVTNIQQRMKLMTAEQKRRSDLAEAEKQKRAKLQLQGVGTRLFRDDE